MKLRAWAIGLALAAMAALPAAAQRGGGPGNWELLGEEKVGIGGDRDVITIRQSEDYYRDRGFRRLRFVVGGGDVKVRSVRLVYINGQTEDLNFSGNLQSGQQVDVDLKAERSYIRAIEFDYASKFGFSLGSGGLRVNQATMKVFGENVRGGGPSRPVAVSSGGDGARWVSIADARFDRTDSRINIPVGREQGRIGQIRLRVDGERVSVRELRVEFGRGEPQIIAFREDLENGVWTRPIDLVGDLRVVERIVAVMDPRRRPGPAKISMQGIAREGREGREESSRPPPNNRNSWVPLARQSVGFGSGRAVIRVGQKEEWFRDRGFDKLHFAPEGNEIYMQSIRVVYINGSSEDYRVDKLIPAGGDLAVDLPGSRSYIREIEMSYRARPGYRGEAVLNVFGEPVRR
jgi:hypothetical protein